MSNEGLSQFHILVPSAAIPQELPLAFELYVKVGEKFVKVANQNERLDLERLNRYIERDRDVLYIDRPSLERFMDARFHIMYDQILSPLNDIEQRFNGFIRCLELCLVDLKIVSLSADKFMRLDMLIEASFDFFKNRELRRIMNRIAFKGIEGPITRRAIIGSILTLNMVWNQNDCTPATFRSLFIGCLFRDLSVRDQDGHDPHMIIQFDDALDMIEFQNHPIKSVEMLKPYNLVDDVVQALIEQHHELPRGNGFPRGLKRVETYQPAQQLGLADFAVTAFERYKLSHALVEKEAFLEMLKEIMPEENQKSLPLLLRCVGELFD